MDVVIPYRRSKYRDRELRYALRSLSNMTQVERVFVIGERPEWLQNVEFIEMHQGEQKAKNARRALLIACNSHVSDDFILLADDIYATRKIDEIKVYHGGKLSDFLAKFNSRYPESYYTKKLRDTIGVLSDGDAPHYELHLPFIVNKHAAKSLLENKELENLMFRTMYGNTVYSGGGEEIKDVKYFRRTSDRWYRNSPTGFISSDDEKFKGEIEEYLKELFPERSKYEKW